MSARFLEEIRFEAFDAANAQEDGNIRLQALLRAVLDRLEETGVATDPQIAFFQRKVGNRTAEVHAFSVDVEDDVLSLYFFVDANGDESFGSTWSEQQVGKEHIDRGFARLTAFVELAEAGKLGEIEESQPVAELIDLITDAHRTSKRLSMAVLTTGNLSNRAVVSEPEHGVQHEVWDLVRLARVAGASRNEPLSVDFLGEFGVTLPCLTAPPAPDGLQVLLTRIPGEVLAHLYNRYRSRLLERNVRSFLQFTGKVNQGIRETVLTAPSRFLPYNNGIAGTAADVEMEVLEEGLARITKIHDFQIVNGGQTTATTAAALRKDGADLSAVSVAMKLTIVPEGKLNELVPLIAKYANTQNRIQEADFSANHPWHVGLERLSRETWAPATEESPRGTRWYYERSRGQYADDLAAATTPAAKKRFRAENPPGQKIGKTDLAKFVLSWDQRPSIVSRGAQKAFAAFMTQISGSGKAPPEKSDLLRITAQAIVFKTAERLYGDLGFQGYRAQVVTYAVARLSHETQRRLPWDAIWRDQQVPTEVRNALKLLVLGLRDVIVVPPGSKNVTEWCKTEECWLKVLEVSIQLDLEPAADWQPYAMFATYQTKPPATGPLLNAVVDIPAVIWLAVSKWAKENNALQPWQRSIAYSVGKLVDAKRAPSMKQAVQARKLLLDAVDAGFIHIDLSEARIEALRTASPTIS